MCLYPMIINGNLCPCGKCMECSISKANEWSYRVCLEASLYEHNCMLTLTYDNEHLPDDNSLHRRDIQLFLKRLRKHLEPQKIRYFGCGEYGDKRGRPHFHIIIFNYDPSDKYYFFTDKKKNDLYRSPTIEKLWTNGLSSVGEVNFDTARYCALYLQKKLHDGRQEPFTFMSRKPGLGFDALKEEWLDTDKIYINGKYTKLPRYFLNVFEKRGFETRVFELKQDRKDRQFALFAPNLAGYRFCDPITGEYWSKYYYYDWKILKKSIDDRREKFRKIFQKDFYEKR